MSEPATKDDLAKLESKMLERFDRVENGLRGEMHDLRGEMSGLRGEMSGLENGLRGEMNGLENGLRDEMSGLRGEMHGMEKRLSWEIGHGINAIGEMVRDQIRVIDEKYADLPGRVGRLEEHDR